MRFLNRPNRLQNADSECKEVNKGDEQPMKKSSSECAQAENTGRWEAGNLRLGPLHSKISLRVHLA